jgi:hypothetical protein
MARRSRLKCQETLSILHSLPEGESKCKREDHFDSDDDEGFIPQNVSSESEDSDETNAEGMQLFTFNFPFIWSYKAKIQ